MSNNTEKKAKEVKPDRYLRITMSDAACLFYWVLIFFTIFVFTGIRQDFNDYFYLGSVENKFIFLISSWILTISFFQTALGQKGYLKAVWKCFLFPFSVMRISFSFLLGSRRSYKTFYKQFPLKRVLLLSLPLSYLIAFYKNDLILLEFFKYIIFTQMFVLITWSFKWCINPLKSLEGLKSLKEKATKAKIISGLAKLDKKKDKDIDFKSLIIKKIDSLTKAFNALEHITKKIGSTSFLFSWFLGMWVFVIGNVILGSAAILRIMHVNTEGGVFSGDLFKGETLDYILISAFQFLGSDVHGVNIISRDVLIVLGLLPLASLFLLVVVITAFTMVAQSKFEDAVLETHKEVSGLFTEAVREVHSIANSEIIEAEVKNVLSEESETPEDDETNVNSGVADSLANTKNASLQ